MSQEHDSVSPNLTPATMKPETFQKRFESKVKKTKSCWLWQGRVLYNGIGEPYGSLRISGRVVPATHVAWFLATGYWPIHRQINHTCHNTLCVNPDHIYDGTQKQNVDDMYRAKRQRYGNHKGEKNANRRLTYDEVCAIRASFNDGQTQASLAEEYGVHYSTIHLIVRNKTWQQ